MTDKNAKVKQRSAKAARKAWRSSQLRTDGSRVPRFPVKVTRFDPKPPVRG